jgi:hypothetical protein
LGLVSSSSNEKKKPTEDKPGNNAFYSLTGLFSISSIVLSYSMLEASPQTPTQRLIEQGNNNKSLAELLFLVLFLKRTFLEQLFEQDSNNKGLAELLFLVLFLKRTFLEQLFEQEQR